MLLIEVYDAPGDWKMIQNNHEYYTADFTVGEEQYSFVAEYADGKNMWWVDFIHAKHGSKISKTGKSIEVFATVVDIFKAFVSAKKPMNIAFTAKEPSRIRLYDRLATMVSSSGYQLTKSTPNGDATVLYHFEKKRK